MTSGRARQPHAVLDNQSRILKAKKIIELLGEQRFMASQRILEIGCGSGTIASTLAQLGRSDLEVHAVDVADNRLVSAGYQFTLVSGTQLPFDSGMFDIVISNHVIEHVGDQTDQLHHLSEMRRVMTSSGCSYLAVPNRWRLIEPHYRLALLSWLPLSIADAYVRVTGRGTHYDCLPLSNWEAKRMFNKAGFVFEELTIRAIYSTLKIEFPKSRLASFIASLPRWAFLPSKPLIATLMYRLENQNR